MRQRGSWAPLALFVPLSWLASPAVAATGQQLYGPCASCHGVRGEGNAAVGAPAIAGQSVQYLQRQLQHFRDGLRGTHPSDTFGAQMRAASLGTLKNPADLAAVAKHVASMPKTVQRPSARHDARNGANLYQGKCGACHGGRAEGNEALGAPRLAGLDAAYMSRQLEHFRKGVRGADARDRHGRQMAMMAPLVVTQKDVDDVFGYIHAAGAAK